MYSSSDVLSDIVPFDIKDSANAAYYGKKTAVSISIPKLKGEFTGAGDLFAALFLAWMYNTNDNLKIAMEKVFATMQAVLNETVKYTEGKPNELRFKELRLIESKKYIENPEINISANIIF